MDRNHDRVVTRAEWQGSDESFRQYDWNGDGILPATKCASTPRACARPRRTSRTTRREYGFTTGPGRFAALDRNHDGRIARKEWRLDRELFVASIATRQFRVSREFNRMPQQLSPREDVNP
jgi:hypothetical protein